jgi:hypothetical protein
MKIELQTRRNQYTIPVEVPEGFKPMRFYWLAGYRDGTSRAVSGSGTLLAQVLAFLNLKDHIPADGDYLNLVPLNLIPRPTPEKRKGAKHIWYDPARRKYRLQVWRNGVNHRGPAFTLLAEAEAALPAWLRKIKRIKKYKPKRIDDNDERCVIFLPKKAWKPETNQLWELVETTND